MFLDFFDTHIPSKNVFSLEEEQFKEEIMKKTGVYVHHTCLVRHAYRQLAVYVWADIEKRTQIDNDLFTQTFCKCFSLTEDSYSEIHLYVYDFKTDCVNYSYGHSIVELVSLIKKKFHCPDSRVYLDYAKMTYLIESSPETHEKLIPNKEKIIDLCFKEMKKHDPYGMVQRSDVRLRLVSRADGEDLNDIKMVNHGLN